MAQPPSDSPATADRHPLRRWLPKRLWQSPFGRRVATVAGGTVLGRAVVILASPLLTRLYTPEEFGLFAVYLALLGIAGGVTALRYELAIPLPSSDRTAANLLVLCLALVVLSSLLAGVVVLLAGGPIAVALNVPALGPYLWLLPLGLLGVGCYQALNYWAIRKQAFRRLARTRISQGVGQVAVQLGWGLTLGGPLGLLLGGIIGQAAGIGTLARAVWREERGVFRAVGARSIRRVARRFRRFPLLAVGSALLNSGARQLPALLLALMYGAEVAGWYALGQRVVQVPMQVVGTAVAQVYMSEAAALLRSAPSRLRRRIVRLAGRMLLLGGVPLGAVALGGPWLFELVFGPGWGEAGRYVQVLALAYLGQFVAAPLAQTLQILERQDIHLLWTSTQLVIMALIFWLGSLFEWPPWWLLAFYGAGMGASYAGVFVLVLKLTAHLRATAA